MSKTEIGWADKNLNWYSWNCTKVSPGCKHCYAEALAKRYNKPFHGVPTWRESALKDYQMLKPGDAVFVNTMSDTFHEGVPLAMIQRVFQFARQRPDVNFLILTKRIERVYQIQTDLLWTRNIWLGTSVESRKYLSRISVLREIGTAFGKFISFEPLLEDLGEVHLGGIDGVITGGESGASRRPFNPVWAANIQRQCARDGVQFFHKQGGSYSPGQDRLLNGRTYDDLPWSVEAEPEIRQEAMF